MPACFQTPPAALYREFCSLTVLCATTGRVFDGWTSCKPHQAVLPLPSHRPGPGRVVAVGLETAQEVVASEFEAVPSRVELPAALLHGRASRELHVRACTAS